MIEIDMHNIKSRIRGFNTIPYNVQNEICAACSFVKKEFGPAQQRTYLVNPQSGIIYSGLLPYIISIFKKYDIAYHINDFRIKPAKKFNWQIVNGFSLRDYQERIVNAAIKKKRTIIQSCTSSGKALTLDTPVLTPTGFKPMKDIHIGDIVFDEKGYKTRVVDEYPQGKKDVYEVVFEDGSKVKCCIEHLWKVFINSKWSILNTNKLLSLLNDKNDIYIPIAPSVNILNLSFQLRKKLFTILTDRLVTSSKQLADDYKQLAYSLGYRVRSYSQDDFYILEAYKSADKLKIVSISKLSKEEMKCIAVDSSDHTYICGDFIVTHNTFIMANIMIQFGVQSLIIAPKTSLAVQLKNEFEEFLGIKVGIINGTYVDYKRNNSLLPIIVATPQSVLKYPEILEQIHALFVDECHNTPASVIFKVCSLAKNAYYRIGMSATPWRDDNTDLLIDAVFAPRNPSDAITASELINKGVLTPVNITFIRCKSYYPWEGNYNSTYMKGIVFNEERNRYIVQLAKRHVNENHPTIILVSKVEHGHLLMNLLQKKIYNQQFMINHNNSIYHVNTIEFLSGLDDIDRREVVFKSIRQGNTKLCIATTILDEGLSISNLQCLIMAQGGCSSTRLFQRVGRVIRKHPDKDQAYVYDFMDSNETLNTHSQIRLSLMQMEPAWKIKIVN